MRVDTLIIGAGRSGTTTVCKHLENHSAVCFSVIKEVHYFSIEDLYKRGTKYYHSFFPHFEGQSVSASADTYLLMDHLAINRIKDYNPAMKIIVLLRNPVERAYSSYNYSVNYGHHEPYAKFLDSIEHERTIEDVKNMVHRNNIGHFYGGLYYYHLKKWMDAFSKENILVLKTSEMRSDPSKFQESICHFLNIQVDGFKGMGESRLNQNAIPKSKAFEQFLLNRDNFLRKVIRSTVPSFMKQWIIRSQLVEKVHSLNRDVQKYRPLTAQEREKASLYFREDLKNLKDEFGIEFEYDKK